MKNSISVKPEKARLINILDEIEKGEIKIPVFQRSLIWNESQMKELFDSIVKGYPIGSVLLWVPKESYKCYEDFGPFLLEGQPSSQTKYILDGSQRLSTLFGILTNPLKFRIKDSQRLKKFSLFYNLKDEEFTYLRTKSNQSYLIPLYSIIDTFEYLDFLKLLQETTKEDGLREQLINNAKKINKIFIDYEIPYTVINGGDIKSAVEIFSRVNSTGTEITEDWMLSALLYNAESGFILSEKISTFLNRMEVYNFGNLKRDTILDCIANAADEKKAYFDIKVEDLAKKDKFVFERVTNSVLVNLEKAINFLYTNLFLIDYKLLPYPAQLVFMAEFFRLNPSPSESDLNSLKNWFWVTSYSNYFTIYSISQQRKAFSVFRDFALGKHPTGIFEAAPELGFQAQAFPKEINYVSVRSKILQLFLINRLMEYEKPIKKNETLKEQFIFYSKDRSVGNILIRLESEFQRHEERREVSEFINSDSDSVLLDHFITPNLVGFFEQDEAEKFIDERKRIIQHSEKDFVENLGLSFAE